MIPTWIDRSEYPFTPKQFQVPAGRMRYLDEGRGEPLVMVHGNPSWSFEFRELIKHFSPTHRCLAADHLGFGLSDKPANWDYFPHQHAENLESWLESLQLENITMLVGDWGGPIGLSYAIRHPRKIRRIVITNTWLWSVRDDWYYQVFSSFVGGRIGRWLIRRYNFFAGAILKATYGNRNKLTPEIHQHYQRPFADPEERIGTWVFPKQIIASSEWLNWLWSKRQALSGKLDLILWGMKDIAFRRKELKRWTREFPDARVVRFPAAGHFLTEEEPQALMDELTRLIQS